MPFFYYYAQGICVACDGATKESYKFLPPPCMPDQVSAYRIHDLNSSVKWGHLAYLDPNSTNTIFSTNPMGSSSPL